MNVTDVTQVFNAPEVIEVMKYLMGVVFGFGLVMIILLFVLIYLVIELHRIKKRNEQ